MLHLDVAYGLTNIYVNEENPNFKSVDGVLFSKDGKELVLFPTGKGGSYTVHDTTSVIGSYSFNYGAPESITIPASVKIIRNSAFRDSGLKTVTLSDGLETIEDCVFYGCENLKSVNKIPNTVTTLGKNSFNDCYQLESIILSENLTRIEDFTFADCYFLSSLIIPDKVTSIGASAFYSSGINHIVLPAGLTSIDSSAFGGYCYLPNGIYFKGNAGQWNNVQISYSNNGIDNNFVTLNYDESMRKISYLSFDIIRNDFYKATSIDFNIEFTNSMNGKIIIISLYNGDGTPIAIKQATIDSTYQNVSVDLPEDTWSLNNVSARIMVWDNLSNIKPLACDVIANIAETL